MDVSILLWIGVVLLATVLYLRYNKRRKLPPGPIGVPIFGYYPFLRKDPVKTLTRLGKKYGNVFSLYIGPKYVVVLNDWDAMVDTYSQEPGLYRPPSLFDNVPNGLGISGANGAAWIQTKRLVSKAMKDIGLHRTRWEELIQEEVSEVVQLITQYGTGPLEVKTFFFETFANNIMTLVLGERLQTGHPLTKEVARSVDIIMENNRTLDMMNFSPRLERILKVLGFEKASKNIKDFGKFISDTVDDKISKPEKESQDSFIDSYHRELQNIQTDKRDAIKKEIGVKGNVMALLTGGSDTTRSSTIWALMAMADHPEKQRKVQEELDKVLGRDGSIKWADRSKIPYTYATLLETMRWYTLVPLNTLRMSAEDMQVQGYDIPKGSLITMNMWNVHHDPKYWEEPDKFVPERFLMDGGTKVNASPKSYCPFSYGKRNCPGKLIAMMEVLLYFTTLMHKFKVVPSTGDKVKYDSVLGLTLQATNVKLCFIPRE